MNSKNITEKGFTMRMDLTVLKDYLENTFKLDTISIEDGFEANFKVSSGSSYHIEATKNREQITMIIITPIRVEDEVLKERMLTELIPGINKAMNKDINMDVCLRINDQDELAVYCISKIGDELSEEKLFGLIGFVFELPDLFRDLFSG